jgi:mannose-6-phosphate isomerase-like protein (cupin superfamily)
MQPTTDHERLDLGGDEVTFRSTSAESDGALLALEVRLPPGGGPPALHRHEPFELYRVERGELTFHFGDEAGGIERRVAGAGAVVSIPGGREHTVRNESADEAFAFVVFSPGAVMENFIREAAGLASPSMDDVLAIAAAHGVEITRAVA